MTGPTHPSVDEVLDGAVVVSLPMRTRFRGQDARELMLLRGPRGWAEFAPFPEYGPQESAQWLAAAIEAGWRGLGEPLRHSVPVNATMPAVDAAGVDQVLSRYQDAEAIPAVKIKVAEPGQNLQQDLDRVAAVAQALPGAGLRVDANGGWSIPQAVAVLEQIAAIAGGRFEYAEQPVAGVEPLAQLREELARAGVPVRIAADEAVRKAQDPLRVAQLGAADLIVVKVPPLGGVQRALQIVQRAGLDAVVSSALDSSVGLTAGLALASRLPELPFACGLGTVPLLAADVLSARLVPVSGALTVPVGDDGAVVAPEPDPQLIAQHRVGAERQAWWEQRLRKAYHQLP